MLSKGRGNSVEAEGLCHKCMFQQTARGRERAWRNSAGAGDIGRTNLATRSNNDDLTETHVYLRTSPMGAWAMYSDSGK